VSERERACACDCVGVGVRVGVRVSTCVRVYASWVCVLACARVNLPCVMIGGYEVNDCFKLLKTRRVEERNKGEGD
jgi:hypothetical protein